MKYLIESLVIGFITVLLFIIDKQTNTIADMKAQDKMVIRLQTQLIRDQWLTIQQTKHAVEECINARSVPNG